MWKITEARFRLVFFIGCGMLFVTFLAVLSNKSRTGLDEVLLKQIYGNVSKTYDLGTYENFKDGMSKPELRQKLYNQSRGDFDWGDTEQLDTKLGFKSGNLIEVDPDSLHAVLYSITALLCVLIISKLVVPKINLQNIEKSERKFYVMLSAILTFSAIVFFTFFRYQYTKDGYVVFKTDRITGKTVIIKPKFEE